MKRVALFLVTFAVIILSSCVKKEQSHRVIITGKIENPTSDMVSFTVSGLPESYLTDTAWLDEQGLFRASFELDRCRPVTFQGGTEVSQMYLCPGDSLNISLDTEEFDETIKYEGPGAEKNNFLAEYFLKFDDSQNEDIPNFYELRDTTPAVFLSILDQQYKDAMAFLDQGEKQDQFPKEFTSYMKTRIYFNKISYLQMLSYRSNQDTSEASKALDRELRDTIIHAATFKDPDYLSSEYQSWLTFGLKRHIFSEIRDSVPKYDKKIYDSLYYERLKEILPPFAIQLSVFRNASSYADAYNLEYYEKLKPEIEKYVTDSTWKNALQMKYDELVFKLSQPLPEDAVLYNLDDEDLLDLTFDDILAKYKGKVIYLDFWASWCGPCKAEMPNSKALAEKLKGEDVQFLYVSVDRDAQAWENMIKIMQLHGIHYRLGKNTHRPVSEKYDVRFIPHYVLFDKKGNMIKNDMSRPGEPETEQMIRELL